MIQNTCISYKDNIHLRHIFKLGLMIEERAGSYYSCLAEKAADPDAKRLCRKLIQMRLCHIELIERSLGRWAPLLLDQESRNFFELELRKRGIFSSLPPAGLSEEGIIKYAIEQGNKIIDIYRSFEEAFSDTWRRAHIQDLWIEERNCIKELPAALDLKPAYIAA